jgi:Cytochrome c554 and c-prime
VKGVGSANNRACERCHRDIAEEWRTSRHHQSFTNEEFQRSLAREKHRAFCVDCHAPETTRSGAPTPDEAGVGVGCVTCHLGEHAVLAAPRREPEEAPHAIERVPQLATAQACKKCHEFQFAEPRRQAVSERAQWMQRTWTEHHDGNSEGLSSCAPCHLPREGDHVSHRFRGGHDEGLVKSALSIVARRVAPGAVELTLTPRDVTHAVPTGDLFRRLLLSADTEPPSGKPAVRYLARHHEHVTREQRVEIADDRPFQGPRRVTLELGAAADARPIRYRVSYQRVDYLVGDDEARAVVDGEIELAAGTLAVAPSVAVEKPTLGDPSCLQAASAKGMSSGWLCVALALAAAIGWRRRAV